MQGRVVAIVVLLVFFLWGHASLASVSPLVITELAISGGEGKSENDFVEIANASSQEVSLNGWRLAKKTSSGKEYTLRVFPAGLSISPGGFFVWANSGQGFASSIVSHVSSVETIAPDNSVLLCEGSCSQTQNVRDKVGMGKAIDFESESAMNPIAGKSIIRKKVNGVWQDTDMNRNDFQQSCSVSPGLDHIATCPTTAHALIGLTTIRLNEILPDPKGEDRLGEFIELFNFGNEAVDLKGWTIRDASSTGSFVFENNEFLAPGSFLLLPFSRSKVTLNNTQETLSLFDPQAKLIDSFSYASSKEDLSWGFSDSGWKVSMSPTPGQINLFASDSVGFSGPTSIRLNEVLPNPTGKDASGEFIELFNFGNEAVDLKGWVIQHASKTGKHTFALSTPVGPNKYVVVRSPDIGFSLNNSNETLTLTDPGEQVKDTFSFKTSKENTSWSFDGEKWRMTAMLTPGARNAFESSSQARHIRVPKKVYKGSWVDFSVSTKEKIRWDFGDGHKSYKRTTRHRYEKPGTYTVTLRVSGKSENIEETNKIKVIKYPQKAIQIVEVVPNPDGSDKGKEYLTVRNVSHKTVSLQGWSIATGSEKKKAVNHIVNKHVPLKPGESMTITTDHARIILPNEKGYVAVRLPDKKTVFDLHYGKAEDGMVFRTTQSGEWVGIPKTPIVASGESAKEEHVISFTASNTRSKGDMSAESFPTGASSNSVFVCHTCLTLENAPVFRNAMSLDNKPKRVGNTFSFTHTESRSHRFGENVLAQINSLFSQLWSLAGAK